MGYLCIGIPTSEAGIRRAPIIPIFPGEKIAETGPDYLLILPWNLKNEITAQLSYVRDWGGKIGRAYSRSVNYLGRALACFHLFFR